MEITKDMTIMDVIRVDEGIADILMSAGMHCLGCAMAHGESVEQAAAVHGIEECEAERQVERNLKEFLNKTTPRAGQ